MAIDNDARGNPTVRFTFYVIFVSTLALLITVFFSVCGTNYLELVWVDIFSRCRAVAILVAFLRRNAS